MGLAYIAELWKVYINGSDQYHLAGLRLACTLPMFACGYLRVRLLLSVPHYTRELSKTTYNALKCQ